jgi:hypothetical protein
VRATPMILALLVLPGTAQAATGGPDAAGYRFVDDADGGDDAPSYFVYSGAGGSPIAFEDDSVSGPHPLPFSVLFYGREYNAFYASSNGFISFVDPGHAWCCNGRPLPTGAGPQASIFGIWTDFFPSSAWSRTTTNDSGRVFVYHHEGREIGGEVQLAWQVHFFEDSSTFEVMLINSGVGRRAWTTGIQDHTAGIALQHFYGSNGHPGPRAIRFYDNALPPVVAFADGSSSLAQANRQFDAQVTVSDPEGARPVLTLHQGPPGLRLIPIDDQRSRLLWYPTDADVGDHPLVLRADDGTFVGELDVRITVAGGDDLPPRIGLAHTQATDEHGVFLLNVGLETTWAIAAVDPETQGSRAWTVGENAPAGLAVDGGTLTWTPSAEQTGDAEFYVRSEDAGGTPSERLLRVRVRRSNGAPSIISSAPNEAQVGVDIAYLLGVEDPDLESGDALVISVTEGPSGAFVDAAKVLHFTALESERGNTVQLTTRVTDLQGLFDEQQISLAVGYDPSAPSPQFPETTTVDPGSTVLDAEPNGRGPFSVAWTLLTPAEGASIVPSAGSEATFTAYTAQDYRLSAAVNNGTQYGPSVEALVRVRDLPPSGEWQGEALVLQASEVGARLPVFVDPNREPCSAPTFTSQPAGVGANSLTFTAPGDYLVTATATCGALGASVRQVVRVLPEPASGCGCSNAPITGLLLLLPLLAGPLRRKRRQTKTSTPTRLGIL